MNPESEVGRFLTEVARFPHCVPVAGVVEYAATDGATATLVVQDDGWLKYRLSRPNVAADSLLATYEVDGVDLLRVTPGGEGWHFAFDMAYSAQRLDLSCPHGYDLVAGVLRVGYDFDGDGTWEDASWSLSFTR